MRFAAIFTLLMLFGFARPVSALEDSSSRAEREKVQLIHDQLHAIYPRLNWDQQRFDGDLLDEVDRLTNLENSLYVQIVYRNGGREEREKYLQDSRVLNELFRQLGGDTIDSLLRPSLSCESAGDSLSGLSAGRAGSSGNDKFIQIPTSGHIQLRPADAPDLVTARGCMKQVLARTHPSALEECRRLGGFAENQSRGAGLHLAVDSSTGICSWRGTVLYRCVANPGEDF